MMTKGKAAAWTPEQLERIEQMRRIREQILQDRWRMVEVIQSQHAS